MSVSRAPIKTSPTRYRAYIGAPIDSKSGKFLGMITNVEEDAGQEWYTINDDYQVPCAGSEFVIDLVTGREFVRSQS